MSAALGVDLLCADAWVLIVFIRILCVRGSRRRSFVRRRMGFNTKLLLLHALCSYVDANSMGFKVSAALGVDLLCAGAWALTQFVVFLGLLKTC